MKSIQDVLASSGATPIAPKPAAATQEKRSFYAGACQVCFGSGYADNKFSNDIPVEQINFCNCSAGTARRSEVVANRAKVESKRLGAGCDAALIPPKYRKFRLDSFTETTFPFLAARMLGASGGITQGKGTKNSMFLFGENGAGKTTLGAAVLMERIEKHGDQCLFVCGSMILDEIQDTYNGTGSKVAALDKYRSVPWLMIDELIEGFQTKELTQDKIGILSKTLSHRYDWELPTIITSNLSLDQLSALLRTPKLTDRIFETYAICQMVGNFRL